MSYFNRSRLMERIASSWRAHRIVCLLGPRQCGKTTIARRIWEDCGKTRQDTGYFDLEKPADLKALETPELTLHNLRGLVVIDEIQRRPDLFPYLRYLHDENYDQQFLILGSASRDLIQQSSESLAGRIAFIEVTPFSIDETNDWQKLWILGGFPKSYLLDVPDSMDWREQYMRTYIETDLALLDLRFQPNELYKLWLMLAHYHGQIANIAELSTSLTVSQPTIQRYISYLASSFMLRILKPWHANINKRQVKSPKIYYRDSGLLHSVLGIDSQNALLRHPKSGPSFEGFAIEEIARYHKAHADECYFWATHNGAELDLLIVRNSQKMGFEMKLSDAPSLTPSMKMAMNDLQLDELTVIYPGVKRYHLAENIVCVPLHDYVNPVSNNRSSL